MAVWFERFQVGLYFLALFVGGLVGFLFPGLSGVFDFLVNPFLVVLLFLTFLSVPFSGVFGVFRDWRFVLAVVVLNFVFVPFVVWGLSFLVSDVVVLFGVLLVLLAPCVDYVLVFSRLAGGDWVRLLGVCPLVLVLQFLLLPVFLFWFVGGVFLSFGVGVFVWAFVLFIVLPLVLSVVCQVFSARFVGFSRVCDGVQVGMVPCMMCVLFCVVASGFSGLVEGFGVLVWVVPVFVLFCVFMFVVGFLWGRVWGFDVGVRRVLIFSGCTRNSLVVLPLVLVLPVSFEWVSLVVVLQTFVELVFMVFLVWFVPVVVRD